jgi:hypothetical protein
MKGIYYIIFFCCFNCSAQSNGTKLIFGVQSSHNFAKRGEIIFTPNLFFGFSYNKWSFSAQLEHIGFMRGPKNKMIGFQGDYRFFKESLKFSPLLRLKASTSFYSPYKNQLLSDYFEITSNVNASIGKYQTIPLFFGSEFLLDIKNDQWSVQVGTGYGYILTTYVSSQFTQKSIFHSWQLNVGFMYSIGMVKGDGN